MSENILAKAYSAEEFQNMAGKVMSLIGESLLISQKETIPQTINWQAPEETLTYWQNEFNSTEKTSLPELLEKVIAHSINFHSKGYVGHQVAVTLPLTFLTSAICAYLNNCTTVYELGMAGNAMEKVVVNHLAEKFGYDQKSTGFVVSGGSMGNLTALVTARTSLGIREEDYSKLAIMVSAEAHYSVERAAKIMGIHSENILKIPVNEHFSIRTDLLEDAYQNAVSQQKIVFCIIGCACTTSVGAHDDLNAIADFAQMHQIWFHVDGAHGGAAIFSEKYKHLLNGVHRSDSLIVDFHKMMMAPPLSTAILYNAGERKIREFSPKATYLWQDQLSEEWWNSAKHTLECTKPITILHTYAIMRLYGDEIYRQNVDTLYDLGSQFAKMIERRSDMELALEPSCNIVCFRYIPNNNRNADEVNKRILHELTKEGTYYVVGTTIKDCFYLRTTFMNPYTDTLCLSHLLDWIENTAKNSI
ncbi:pyridoxal phosphate-dependent decarboxylase family protein [Intestinibacillus massiliensis]|uniref:pyridoxal phosphate-dependent decarboxylase family protein n=1 Tax=Intestinibacillus massiliensis TaxID=1871029 RepID=UPI00117A0760|nr:aminotransferase class I/II-fold pyridoxal phosphate-dependent enzyme [Intestinibacillus massiliensis]